MIQNKLVFIIAITKAAIQLVKKDPAAPLKVIDGIAEYLRTAGVKDVSDLVGALGS